MSSHTKEGIVSVVCVLQELSSAPECLWYLRAANLPSLAQQGPSKQAVSAVIIPTGRNGGGGATWVKRKWLFTPRLASAAQWTVALMRP